MPEWELEGEEEGPDRGPKFIAAFDGECSDCGEEILEGDEAGYVDHEVVCIDCWKVAV